MGVNTLRVKEILTPTLAPVKGAGIETADRIRLSRAGTLRRADRIVKSRSGDDRVVTNARAANVPMSYNSKSYTEIQKETKR